MDLSPASNRTSRLSVTTSDASGGDTSRSVTPNIKLPLQGSTPTPTAQGNTWLDAADPERGPIGGGATSGAEGSGGGGGEEGEGEDSWNSRHPCYPHRNPHVARDSAEWESTRIIRIGRDYMFSGDISPAFSSVYPEILETYLPEPRFREVVKVINEGLRKAHDPFSVANWIDAGIGLVTLWIVEEVVDTSAKRKIREVEDYLEEVNRQIEGEGGQAKFIALRKTGYLCLDIQIPDPVITVLDDEEEDEEEVLEEDEREQQGGKPAVVVNGS